MSTSDSDYSIDWLASDEDDYDSPKRLSPQCAEELPVPPSSLLSSSSLSSSSSTTSSKESPTSCFQSGVTQRRRSHCCDFKDGGVDSPTARKTLACTELQCYIQPLSSILRGLRSGRYSERLSSFQESVAMDRIQRILGVLQNPNMGGRFLSIILKIEEMLQSWFPHIKPSLLHTDDSTPPKKQKQHHSSASPPSSPASLRISDVDPTALYSSTHLKWLHTSPICSLKTLESTLGQPAASASPLSARCSNEATQDNAVSSSTDSHTEPPRRLSANPRLSRGPLPFKISSPCLERLLQAKDSIIAPRAMGDGGWPS
ncbi:uncharacterized protein LOC111224333 isoform X3 [Seriola dumerili]|uniref:uncharacterized protein LOC111224333 isoform X3 n=1 Tax=Seriola dumerili TaxID=41447 RepID=UPI000BBE3F5C|nr:uncharacterized protein LOC111224333 isoform X3 [Seriola dumerili]